MTRWLGLFAAIAALLISIAVLVNYVFLATSSVLTAPSAHLTTSQPSCPYPGGESWFVPANSGCGELMSHVQTFTFYDGVRCDTVRNPNADSPGWDPTLKGLQCHRSK